MPEFRYRAADAHGKMTQGTLAASGRDEALRQLRAQGLMPLALDEATMSAVLNGKRIALKAKEFALLQCLYRHRNTIVKKDVLFEEVWGDTFFSDGTLNVHVRKLREKLEEDPNDPKMLKTVWGTGYILEVP